MHVPFTVHLPCFVSGLDACSLRKAEGFDAVAGVGGGDR